MSVAKPYRAGWIEDSYICIRKTDGQLRYKEGAAIGMIARITVANPSAPEIPILDVTNDIGWDYITTEYSGISNRVIYEFELDDEDAEKLQSVVWFFDTLYG